MLQSGAARTRLTPPPGVELAGWGYYLRRLWRVIRDDTAATALVFDDGDRSAAIVAVDLMYLDGDFTAVVRREAARRTSLRPEAICVACSHSHNTPTAAFIRGGGEVDPAYKEWAARQAAMAIIQAWEKRGPAVLRVGKEQIAGRTVNRTREGGPVDTRLSVWCVDDADGRPIAALVNFQAHPVVMMGLGSDHLSRDWPGQVTDILESAAPGLIALFLQGACGDVNFEARWHEPDVCDEPGRAVAEAALKAMTSARTVEAPRVGAAVRQTVLPTRRWDRADIQRDREEADYRLRTGDVTGWLDGFARVIVNHPDRLPERYGGEVGRAVQAVSRFAFEWSESALADLETRPETLTAEVQALRVGDAWLAVNGSEMFTTLALDLRRRWPHDDLMIAGYANESIGYVPDAYDVERRSYAAWQSPRFKDQFPFTAEAGDAMVQGMLDALEAASS